MVWACMSITGDRVMRLLRVFKKKNQITKKTDEKYDFDRLEPNRAGNNEKTVLIN